ncbi:MAG: hypothetical protein LBR58_08635 [Propionibacteriaceae bacterium]|jgi:hypothetical protein|nr:hypothetical protein [Propionibacteriaceae bacterium]
MSRLKSALPLGAVTVALLVSGLVGSLPVAAALPSETPEPAEVVYYDSGSGDEEVVVEPDYDANEGTGRMNGFEGKNTIKVVFLSPDGQSFWNAEQYEAFMKAGVDFWERESRGLVTFSYTAYKSVPMVQTADYCSKALSKVSDLAAVKMGYKDRADFWAKQPARTHLLLLRPAESNPAFCTTWSATDRHAIIVTVDTDGPGSKNLQTLAHELGHNFGLDHTGGARCPEGVVDGPFDGKTCQVKSSALTDDHYNDFLTIMGNTNQSVARFGLSSQQKSFLGIVSEGKGQTTVSSGDKVYDLVPSAQQIKAGSSSKIQVLRVLDKVSGVDREYSIQYDAAAGGIAIRRVQKKEDPTANITACDTILINPGRTLVGNRMVFGAGEVFTSLSGKFSLRVESITAEKAQVRVKFGAKLSPFTANVADDYGSSKAGAYEWNVSSQPKLTGMFGSQSDEDWFTFVAPSTGQVFITAPAPVGSMWLTEVVGVNMNQVLSNAYTYGDLVLRIDAVQGNRYWVKAAPSYSAPSLLGAAYTLEARMPNKATISLSAGKWTAPGVGGSTSVKVTSKASGKWTASVVGPVTLSKRSGSSGESVTLTVPANVDADHTGKFHYTVSFTGADGWRTDLDVEQPLAAVPVMRPLSSGFRMKFNGREFNADTAWSEPKWTVPSGATTLWGTLATNQTGDWAVSASVSWLHATYPASWFEIKADANTSNANRTGTVTFKRGSVSYKITVYQLGKPLSASPATVSVVAVGQQSEFKIAAGTRWVAYVSGNSWLWLDKSGGTGNATVTLRADKNTGGACDAKIVIYSNGEWSEVTVKQSSVTAKEAKEFAFLPQGSIPSVKRGSSGVIDVLATNTTGGSATFALLRSCGLVPWLPCPPAQAMWKIAKVSDIRAQLTVAPPADLATGTYSMLVIGSAGGVGASQVYQVKVT